MQTKQKIQQLLASAGASPNHRRGQNFLIDLNLMNILIESANIKTNDLVLEIGSGTGSLSEEIVKYARSLIIVEIDTTLANITKDQIKNFQNFHIFNTDILQSKNTLDQQVKNSLLEQKQKCSGQFLLVANLPYSIACPAMINLTTSEPLVDKMFVTVQKEVAQRMIAKPDTDNYGPISIYLDATGDLKLIKTLKPSVFWPQPQVDSAFVSYTRNIKKANRIHNINLFTKTVSLFMQHRRKMLKACTKFAQNELLKIHRWDDVFHDCCIDPHKRPENLSTENYIAIANICSEMLQK